MANEEKRGKQEEKVNLKLGAVLGASAIIFMIGCVILLEKDVLRLHPSNTRAENLNGFSIRFEYAVRYQTLLVFWLTFNTFATILVRFKEAALNPLEEKSEAKVQWMKNILTNSFESIVISVFSQLIFVSFAEPLVILKYIPLINILQFIGRVAFFAGYPMKRSFGYFCTNIPNSIMSCYNVYHLGRFLEFY